jgi:hypothetical protein
MLHPNEVKLTPQNLPLLMSEATALGPAHEDALTEQATRQGIAS